MTFETRYSGHGKWWWYTPRHRWFEYSPHAPGQIPPLPACYVITLDGVSIYVGQTLNLRTRFYKHGIKCTGESQWQTRWGPLTGEMRLKVKYGQRYGDWCMREARLIQRLQPRFNLRAI